MEKVSGSTITVIEGNYSDSVKRRTLQVNGRYIRGYGLTAYDASTSTATSTKPTSAATSTTVTKKVSASKYASVFDKNLAGSYTTIANLNMRDGAGTTNKVLTVLPKGTVVKNYGYYSAVNGTKWLYVQVTLNGIQYTGFCSGKYLKK